MDPKPDDALHPPQPDLREALDRLHEEWRLIVYEEEDRPVVGLEPLADRIWHRLAATISLLLASQPAPAAVREPEAER